MTTRRQFNKTALSAAGATLLGAGYAGPASSQGMIDTLRMIVGFPPGGTTDAFARRMAEKLRGVYATNVVVENKPGAGGQIGVMTVRDAPADGTAMLFTPGSMITIYPHSYPKLQYKPSDVLPISTGLVTAFGLGVGPAVPASVTNVKEFITWLKANPSMANYGTPGAGSMPHMVAALLDKAAGTDMKQVAYRGSGPAIIELLGGQLTCFSSPIGDYLQHLASGKIRLLAVSGKARSKFAPTVPTYAEQGFPELTMEEWFGFFMPAKTPAAIANRMSDALKTLILAKDVADFAAPLGLVPTPSASPEEFAKLVKSDSELWGGYVKRIGFSAES
jgi:tripartite-type tricarboxylate transporter receptor subunit TctC